MSADFIAALTPIREPALAAAAVPQNLLDGVAGSSAAQASFANLVSGGLEQVNQQLQASQVELNKLASGNVENLHQVMIKLEESRIAFQLMLQVRNRLLESYQEVMRMQV